MRKDKIALFPISVDSHIFTSENVIPAIKSLSSYNTILFFVADGTQRYNKAIWAASEAEIWSAHSRSPGGAEYKEQRKVWLERLKKDCSSSGTFQTWKVVGVEDITYPELVISMRNLGILFDTSIKFRRDVVAAATEYVCSRRQVGDLQKAKNLSIRYILEEMACNVVIKMLCGVRDEYYMGSLATPLVAVYAGKYPASVFNLCGRATNDCRFRFFTWEPQGGECIKGRWRLVEDIAARPSEARND